MLADDLKDLARAIVQGAVPPSQIDARYAHYPVEVALEVYRNNYRGNLHDALAGVYPVVAQLVGPEFFRFTARQFIERHRPQGGNLHHYGREMADFLATFEPACGLPYLPDVARLEWACHCAYFAEDADALTLADLAGLPPDNYAGPTLRLHPACQLVRSRFPLAEIWRAHQPDASDDFHIDLDSGPCNALVSRQDGRASVSELDEVGAMWLQAVRNGCTLGVATDAALQSHPDFDLQLLLRVLLEQDALSVFDFGGRA